ncbi:MAG: tRNA (guanosine(37)-N1)-methyltransferase TrmD [Rhodospirillaceae bacterium]|mgnify:FL=1|nr:tRNA (guanosine(37)-N1)-methyltransferase TrmD [Rhodospirillaceae bacterium]
MSGASSWTTHLLTLFPGMFPGALGVGLSGSAMAKGLWTLKTVDIRTFAGDKHGSVDGAPYGGGAGMVLRSDVVARALDSILDDCSGADGASVARVCLTPRGLPVSQKDIRRFVSGSGMVLLCGRFEGIDQRVIEARDLEEISLGDIVLSSGEPAALALIDACVRLLPGVMGNDEGLVTESFERELLEYPHYTRPRIWEGLEVPEILTSGDHKKIDSWRRQQAEVVTKERRPDMWKRYKSMGLGDKTQVGRLEGESD